MTMWQRTFLKEYKDLKLSQSLGTKAGRKDFEMMFSNLRIRSSLNFRAESDLHTLDISVYQDFVDRNIIGPLRHPPLQLPFNIIDE